MAGAMSIGESTTGPFEISLGLKQECVMAPTLFTLEALLYRASEYLSEGVGERERERDREKERERKRERKRSDGETSVSHQDRVRGIDNLQKRNIIS